MTSQSRIPISFISSPSSPSSPSPSAQEQEQKGVYGRTDVMYVCTLCENLFLVIISGSSARWIGTRGWWERTGTGVMIRAGDKVHTKKSTNSLQSTTALFFFFTTELETQCLGSKLVVWLLRLCLAEHRRVTSATARNKAAQARAVNTARRKKRISQIGHVSWTNVTSLARKFAKR